MSIFTILNETVEHREANDGAIAETPSIGEAVIHRMADGRVIFVSPQATQANVSGFYIQCFDKQEAQELARCGVIVFDGDKIYDSLSKTEKNLFQSCREDECYVDNPVVQKIASALLLQESTGQSVLDLPIRYYCVATPILLPNEFEFLKTATRANVTININTAHTKITYP
ncbi:hypothetical protein GCM10011533_22840 [Streptosporangium jomthongense]|uniref:Uncharacterized protein n=1 Tax=Marinobacter aromaticivorans TaxID=1494078 RepID=A0ABW2IX14_9GAMM|nr:hypothetical protein [Marinobacter aromaticivorans]GGE69877.1 hypothetical protein GCM10011533_22840 [Streptosporangium jomthongense]